ncbi:MAG: serine hydrolase domain-containing protein [Candidatus Thermoplasmatota archaeon]|nr:serine hydrolase domain-containing protein [Candidatus Thermoplasmatota archaeon]
MNNSKRVALLLVTTLVFAPFSSADKHGIIETEESDIEEYHQQIEELLSRWQIPGGQVVVLHNGSFVMTESFGFADVENNIPVGNNSKFRIASLSKAITAASILTLIEDGSLSLDDKMVDRIPHLIPEPLDGCDYPNFELGFSIDDVTISHLLNHRGGWDLSSDPTYWHWNTWHIRNDPCIDKEGLNSQYENGNTAPMQMESVLMEWLRHPLNYEPGTDYVYSNIGYQILGQIIEQISGQSYESYAIENVLTPMGITSMEIGMTMPEQRDPNEVLYYDYEDDRSLCHFPSGTDEEGDPVFDYAADPDCGDFVLEEKDGGGGWISTTSDYAKFIAHLDGTLFTSVFSDPFEFFIGNPSAPSVGGYYGRGVYIASTDTQVWNHNGAFSGSSTAFKRDVTDSGESVISVLFINTRPTSSETIDGKTWKSDRYSTIGKMMQIDYSDIEYLTDSTSQEELINDADSEDNNSILELSSITAILTVLLIAIVGLRIAKKTNRL